MAAWIAGYWLAAPVAFVAVGNREAALWAVGAEIGVAALAAVWLIALVTMTEGGSSE